MYERETKAKKAAMPYRINYFAVKVQKQTSAMDLILLHRWLIKTQSVVSAQGPAALYTLMCFPWGSNWRSRTHFWHLISVSLSSSFCSCPSTCLPVYRINEVSGFSTSLPIALLYNAFQKLLTDIYKAMCLYLHFGKTLGMFQKQSLAHNMILAFKHKTEYTPNHSDKANVS